MSYTVLARRYRSSDFDSLIGQEHVSKTLKRAIESGRIAHAFLFCGTRGTGKTSTARILAKCLNCQSSDQPTTHPCGKCNSCQAITRGESMDVIEIDAASNTQVDKTRAEIIDNVQFRPAHSRFKVFIIDEVHMLSKASFNALLKTLEEPPEHVKFILATTEAEKVLPTILSRCQRYDFRNIPTREIAAHLKTICDKEKIKASDDALMLVAKAGAGSMRDALSLLDRLLSVGESELNVELIEQLLGMPRSQSIFDLAQVIGAGDIKSALLQTDKLIRGGLAPDTLVTSLADHLRNLLILRTCGKDSELVELPGLSLNELVKQADQFDPIALTQDIAILEELRRNLRLSGAGRSLLDATIVRLTLAEQFTSIAELISGTPATPAQKKKPESDLVESAVTARDAVLKALAPVLGREGLGEGRSAQNASMTSNASSGNPPLTPALSPEDGGEGVVVAPSHSDEDDELPAVGKIWSNDGPSLSELMKQHSAAEEPKELASQPSNIEPVDPSQLPAVWSRLLETLNRSSPSIPALLQGATLTNFEDGLVTLRYQHDHASAMRIVERNGKKEAICSALAQLLNQPVGVRLELEDAPKAAEPSRAEKPAAPAPRRSSVAEMARAAEPVKKALDPEVVEELKKNELIKSILDTLGGEIVKVE